MLIQPKLYSKTGQVLIPVFAVIVLLAGLNQFALAQTEGVQQDTPTVIATSEPAETLTPTLAPLPGVTPVPTEPSPSLPVNEAAEALLRQSAEAAFAGRLPANQTCEVGLTKIAGEWALVNWRVSESAAEAEPAWHIFTGLAHW